MESDTKIVHLGHMLNQRSGAVSPLCAARPKSIDLSKETWTNRCEAVTCPKCKAMIEEAVALAGNEAPEKI